VNVAVLQQFEEENMAHRNDSIVRAAQAHAIGWWRALSAERRVIAAGLAILLSAVALFYIVPLIFPVLFTLGFFVLGMVLPFLLLAFIVWAIWFVFIKRER
jgi:hypothetical protein